MIVKKLKIIEVVVCLKIIVLIITRITNTTEIKRNSKPKIFEGNFLFMIVNKNADWLNTITKKKEI